MNRYDVEIDLKNANDSHNMILQQIEPESTVLEFGPATGGMTQYMREKLRCSVYIVEIDEEAFQTASQWAEDGICENIEEYAWLEKFAGIKFDYILFADVLEHLSDPTTVLLRAKDMLKDTGKVIASVPNLAYIGVLAELCQNQFQYRETGLLDRTHIHFFAYSSFVSLFEENGYRITVYDATHPRVDQTEFMTEVSKLTQEQLRFLWGKSLGDVYQFVFTAVKEECFQSAPVEVQNRLDISGKIYDEMMSGGLHSHLYYDCGKGFREKNIIQLDAIVNGHFHQRIDLPRRCKTIRFDPVEGRGCLIQGLQVHTDSAFLRVGSHNGLKLNDLYLFRSTDPQFCFEGLPAGSKWVEIEADIVLLEQDVWIKAAQETEALADEMEKKLDAAGRDLTDLQGRYGDLEGRHGDLERRYSDLEGRYADLNGRHADLEGQYADLNGRHADLEGRHADLESRHAELEGRYADLEGRHADLEGRHAELEGRHADLEGRHADLEGRHADLEGRYADLEGRHADLEGRHAELEGQYANLKVHYTAAIGLRDDLTRRLAATDAELTKTFNSASWKVTKPLRVVKDFTFRALRSNRFTLLFCRGLLSLKNDGVGTTWRKVKDVLRHRKDYHALAAEPLYTPEELEAQRRERFPRKVRFSIVVPLYNTPEDFLRGMIDSVREQTYRNWELCLADGSDQDHGYVGDICRQYARKDKRVVYRKLEHNGGISENTNAGLDMSTGDYIGLLDHDDLLHPAVLHDVMEAICGQDADFVYTDEATFESPDINKIVTAHFKPDFAIDNLRANNYICHFSAFSREVMGRSGGFRPEYDGSQDHDMILRLTGEAKHVVHIPKILYYWRSHAQSTAQDISTKEYAITAGRRAVRDSILKAGYATDVESSRAFPTIYRIKYEIKEKALISIVIPNKNHCEDLKRCIDSILTLSTYENFEIIIVDNGSDEEDVLAYYDELKKDPRIGVYSLDIPFNYSKLNNFGAKKAKGKYYLLLNNDTAVITPEWMEELLMYVQRDDVAAAGAMLYYPDDTIQHAGIILGLGADRVAGHAFYKQPRGSIGYMGRLCYTQDMSAVTAACMMVKASAYWEIGGFDERMKVSYNDVDFCLRLREQNYLVVWTPYAELYHYESKSRGLEDTPEKRHRFLIEAEHFRTKWHDVLAAGDPYYNPNFSLDRDDFSLK